MNLVRSLLKSHLRSRIPLRNVSISAWYSTETLPSKRNAKSESLYRRISPVGSPEKTVVPVLDQWISEGRNVSKRDLQQIIKELRHYRRFKHALEVSQWMTDKRYMDLSPRDVAVRLDLISKVHGIEQAEKYFENVPKHFRKLEVYGALLNCYTHEKCVDKAEAIMLQMKDLGLTGSILNYNTLLNVYYQTGNRAKLDLLICELEKEGINFDKFTYGILLSAYGAYSDVDALDKIMAKMGSDPELDVDWSVYATAANQYLRSGCVEKGLELLRKSEKLIGFSKKRSDAYHYILTQYAATGVKEEVWRIWKKYKQNSKVTNRGYICMISSLLKFDDVEASEQVFEEWEDSDLNKDIRIPNLLIGAYANKGLMGKAEDLVEKAKLQWEEPNSSTWLRMSKGYLLRNETSKAIEMMKIAVSECKPGWKPDEETLVACLKQLKEERETDELVKLVKLLEDKGIVSADVYSNFLEDDGVGRERESLS